MARTTVSNAREHSYPPIPVLRDTNTTGEHIQVVRFDVGVGTAESRVSSSNPLPVTVDGSVTASVSGTVTTQDLRGASATLSNVAGSASSVTLLASNANRIRASIVNDSTATLYVKEDSGAASTSSYSHILFQYDEVIVTDYTGQINGIWSSSTGNARVTEL